ncbi:Translation initiation factor IF-2, mitochondrial [Lamellibrachia satsuma]|nr:Translation initiation factor IF-2, mitochondrial [Lamellibrachia satsuma]
MYCFKQQPVALVHSSTPLYAGKRKNTKKKIAKPIQYKPKGLKESHDVVTVYENITVQELAEAMGKDVDHVFEVMLYIQYTDRYDSPGSVIDNFHVVKDIIAKSGLRLRLKEKKKAVVKENKDVEPRPPPEPEDLVRCPPVVTVMGHVDHGKTTLLDMLRKTNVVDKEFGGITQHIGAFSVQLESGETITFLDTPGHAAFSAMRARGAHVTDIVVLVVAVDDGVMGQTVECIRHAQEAEVPIIVALNKVDKAPDNVERVKKSLLQHGIQLEDFGGDVQAIPISALKGDNVHQLEEAIVALSEMMDVKADPTGFAEGTVIESKFDTGRGKLATVLVQRGTLKKGACLVAGTSWAKVRGMFDDNGRPVLQASPGTPVELIGWRMLPSAGDTIQEVESERRAKEAVEWRDRLKKEEHQLEAHRVVQERADVHREDYQRRREIQLGKGHRRSSIYRKDRVKEIIDDRLGPKLEIVIKGDVDGSVEAILDTLDSYASEQCRLHILQYGVGAVTEQDIEMAANFGGIVYGFNVDCPETVRKLARSKKVSLRAHNIIYKLMDDIREELTSRLPPKIVEEVVGEANVLQSFMVTDGKHKVPVAGCRCVKGILQKKLCFKLLRNGESLLDGGLSSLKHFKNEVDSIKTDVECGICFDDKTITPQHGDRIICYERKEVAQQLEWDIDF